MPNLLFFRQGEKLLEHHLPPGRTTIGRADTCDIALPGDSISRTHCFIDGRGKEWTIQDRSRHGTWLNGERLSERTALSIADRLQIGDFEILFAEAEAEAAPTADALPARTHEEVIDSARDALHVEQARLVVVEGDEPGRRLPLERARLTLGGPGSDLVLRSDAVRSSHCRLHASQGRVMIEPLRGEVWLDARRLRALTPLYPDEEFRVGDVVLRAERAPVALKQDAVRFGQMRGRSQPMRRLFGRLRVMAGHDEPVLIMGESGTGKELAAQGLHEHSPRAPGPFVPINCGALPAHLLESELFGYEKGAFTGASERRDGAFQQAHGGTLFLDELGEMPTTAQTSLLRALSGGGVRRIGSFVPEYPDVRIIAATNKDLVQMVREGTFREDLFFRLETLYVELPPLRERGEDIELLARHFARDAEVTATITPDALATLRAHGWPGNVRELRNVIRRAIFTESHRIDAHHLVFHQLSGITAAPTRAPFEDRAKSPDYIRAALQQNQGNRSAAARDLGVSRSTLLHRMKKLGIS